MEYVRHATMRVVASIGLVVLAASGCSSSSASDQPDASQSDASTSASGASGASGSSGASDASGAFSSGDAAPTDCTSLECSVPTGCATTLTGTVYDPAGANPVYNAIVYIPNDPTKPLPAIPSGMPACNSCVGSIGDYVAATTSQADGTFTLTGVPAGKDIPIVVQTGKWRRMATIPEVQPCTSTALPGSSMTRLPAKQSEGDIPQMALVTGGEDNLGCLLKGIGLDPSEFSAPHAGGRVDVYQGLPAGAGGSSAAAPGLSSGTAGDCTTDNPSCVWHSVSNLEAYDMVLLGCEGDTYDPAESDAGVTNKTASAKAALHDWLGEGGRVFAIHDQYTWFKNGPADLQGVATWLGRSAGSDTGTYSIDTTSGGGMALRRWLSTVDGASPGGIARTQVGESVGPVTPPTQRWIYNPGVDTQSGDVNDTKYLSFLTPVDGTAIDAGTEASPQYCGKAVFSDIHAGGSPAGAIPGSCAGPPLSPQLQLLEFMFFDLSSCVVNEARRVLPPAPPMN
jgi:hypothetical protein